MIGRVLACFQLRDLIMLHRRERLHLFEHDSTDWVHFCLLEIFMLWWICALSFCICGSEGEEELRGSAPVLQEEGNPNRAKASSASRVYESQSAFLRLVKVRWVGSGRFIWKELPS